MPGKCKARAARKSAPCRAPRYYRARWRTPPAIQDSPSPSRSPSDDENEQSGELEGFAPSRDDYKLRPGVVTKLEIQLAFSVAEEKCVRNIQDLEAFDFDNAELMKQYQPEFIVRRQPTIKNLSEKHKAFLDQCLKKASSRYRKSKYVNFQDCADFDQALGTGIPQENDPVEHRKSLLANMLKDGKLHGCVLRGNKETGQFGLVATQDLEQWTPIAVDCGTLWSEDLHDKWLREIGNSMSALSSTSIPAWQLSPLFSCREWMASVDKNVRGSSFVVNCFSEETR